MSLVHYGFSIEEVYWIPIGELEDYIQLLNKMEEDKSAAISSPSDKEGPKTFQDVFRNMENPLRKKS